MNILKSALAGLVLLLISAVLPMQPALASPGEQGAPWQTSLPDVPLEKTARGVIVPVGNQYVYAEVCAPDVIRVACATNPAFFARKSLAAQPLRLAQTDWKLETNSDEAILTTPKLQARVALATGAVSFFDSRGHPVLEEAPHGRTLTPRLCRATRRFMGAFTRIPIQWDNASGTLTIGRRQGSFKGM